MRAGLRAALRGLLLAAVLLLLLFFAFRAFLLTAYPLRYREWVELYSSENGLDTAFVSAVIHTESSFQPDAVSSVGARGLMQLTEETFEWVRWKTGDDDAVYDDLFEPQTNIRYGCCLLRLLLEEFGSEETALAAYHAGWGSVKGWLQEPEHSSDGVTLDAIPFADTARYVPRVLRTKAVYRSLYF